MNTFVFKFVVISLVWLAVVLCPAPATAQTPSPAAAEQRLDEELRRRDIPRAQFERRLRREGIDPATMTEAELRRAQPRILVILDELESRNVAVELPTDRTDPIAPDTLPVPPPVTDTLEADPPTEEIPDPNEIYGHRVFRNKSLQPYRTTPNATPPDSYPLRVNDRLSVAIFGASQTDFLLVLDEDGFVTLPVGGGYRIPLEGVPVGEARRLLASRLRNFYTFREGQLSIRVRAVPAVRVNVFGEVENVGSFSMSSVNTAFNALVAAGGPTARGSVRNIQLIRGEETIPLDVYEYLNNPTQTTNRFLADNATVFVPLAENVVRLTGGVARPLRYELRAGETISDLLRFAGGLLPRAETGNIRVTRYRDGRLELLNVDLATQPDFVLENEDKIDVPIVTTPVENYVVVDGAVLLPGRYAFAEGMSVERLLELGRLRPNARRDVAFLFRVNDDGSERLERLDLGEDAGAMNASALRRGDSLRILSATAFLDPGTVTVEGAVRDTSVTLPFPSDGGLTLEEAVLLAGGTQLNANREVLVTRTSPASRLDKEYLRLDLTREADAPLSPGDVVRVYPRERFADQRTVSIAGAVRQPGTYPYAPDLTLDKLLFMAGGLRLDALRQRVEIYRLRADPDDPDSETSVVAIDLTAGGDVALAPDDEVVIRTKAEFPPSSR